MSDRVRLATRLNDVADDLVNHAAEDEADEANYAAHDLRKAARLLREQEREPDAWASPEAASHFSEGGVRYSAGLTCNRTGANTVEVYFATPPTSTSGGDEERMPLHRTSHVWGVGRICDDCEVHAGDPDALEPCPGPAPPEPESEGGWRAHTQYRRPFNCACGYQGWEYRNEGGPNTLVCTKCGNGRLPESED